jgi:DNA replication protein DnaC
LATAIGCEAIKRDLKVLSFSTHKLLRDQFAARADGSYAKLMHKVASADLVILAILAFGPSPRRKPKIYMR